MNSSVWNGKDKMEEIIMSDPGDEQPGTYIIRLIEKRR